MRLLIDTHILLWALYTPDEIRAQVRPLLEAPEAEIYVSLASVWEIAMKVGLGKLRVTDDLPAVLESAGLKLLPISAAHAWHVRTLAHFHGDPFDRLILAQAVLEQLTLVTRDAKFADYGVQVIRA